MNIKSIFREVSFLSCPFYPSPYPYTEPIFFKFFICPSLLAYHELVNEGRGIICLNTHGHRVEEIGFHPEQSGCRSKPLATLQMPY